MDSCDSTVAAFNPKDKSIVIVAMNANTDDLRWKFDLSDFDKIDEHTKITAIRTSGTMSDGENWADVSKSVNIKISEDGLKFETDIRGSSVTTFIIRR